MPSDVGRPSRAGGKPRRKSISATCQPAPRPTLRHMGTRSAGRPSSSTRRFASVVLPHPGDPTRMNGLSRKCGRPSNSSSMAETTLSAYGNSRSSVVQRALVSGTGRRGSRFPTTTPYSSSMRLPGEPARFPISGSTTLPVPSVALGASVGGDGSVTSLSGTVRVLLTVLGLPLDLGRGASSTGTRRRSRDCSTRRIILKPRPPATSRGRAPSVPNAMPVAPCPGTSEA